MSVEGKRGKTMAVGDHENDAPNLLASRWMEFGNVLVVRSRFIRKICLGRVKHF